MLDDILMHSSGKGSSSKNSLSDYLEELNDYGLIGKLFPYLSFSIWILKNSGLEVSFRNLDYILLMNYAGIRYQIKQFLYSGKEIS